MSDSELVVVRWWAFLGWVGGEKRELFIVGAELKLCLDLPGVFVLGC